MTKQKINCEQDAITWVSKRIPIIIESTRKVRYFGIDPFRSHHARELVSENLGKELWKLLTNK